jgi:hypothetical protein
MLEQCFQLFCYEGERYGLQVEYPTEDLEVLNISKQCCYPEMNFSKY